MVHASSSRQRILARDERSYNTIRKPILSPLSYEGLILCVCPACRRVSVRWGRGWLPRSRRSVPTCAACRARAVSGASDRAVWTGQPCATQQASTDVSLDLRSTPSTPCNATAQALASGIRTRPSNRRAPPALALTEHTGDDLTDSAQCLSAIVTHHRRLTAWKRHDLGAGVRTSPSLETAPDEWAGLSTYRSGWVTVPRIRRLVLCRCLHGSGFPAGLAGRLVGLGGPVS